MNQKVISIIMGGGRGSRLHPLTRFRCKPAVPLAGKYRLVDIPISNCIHSGLNQIFLLTQFNTASLHRHIQESYKFDPFSRGMVEILSAEQTEQGDFWYQGTADAVRQNLVHFGARRQDLILILSGDQLYRMDFREMIKQHKETRADVTLSAIPMHRSLVHEFGLMRIKENLEITEFVEKPKDPAVIESLLIPPTLAHLCTETNASESCLASMGLYIFNAGLLMDALDSEHTDFGKEVIPGLLGKAKLCSYIYDSYWEDIGTVKAFFEANLRLTDAVPPFNFFDEEKPIYTRSRYLPAAKLNACHSEKTIISDGCILSHVTTNRAVIGVRSVVREGTTLDNVVMMGSDWYETAEEVAHQRQIGAPLIGIGQNCFIKNAIIDKNARIGDNVRLDPSGKPENAEFGDIVIRDGVLVVPKSCVVPSGTRI
jgi:glucose-1-phosphate adenylyltransferase